MASTIIIIMEFNVGYYYQLLGFLLYFIETRRFKAQEESYYVHSGMQCNYLLYIIIMHEYYAFFSFKVF